MPWACSKASRLGLTGLALLALVASTPVALADQRWRQGVFPVARFLAYTSPFGGRIGPDGIQEHHGGLDIAAPLGSPILSWWGGVVESVFSDGRCGLGVLIRSGDYRHLYCHLAGQVSGRTYTSGRLRLVVGQQVRGGQLIGHVGMSGRSTGPHLHWAISHRGRWLDPAAILRAMARSRPPRQVRP
ncbi:M23 family metallopeptidase [Synechococcus sp. CS-1325]|uniref:M23 family metallopeptidase n=1 Tax=Synechococcus sp. CS-1326 TaxID=2847978 RepID=UPI000DB560F2|nr:M23 family metallopeptidase [Synechococcus sp. CS-1326]MCT0200469.1 M23 family metallopeptidase [Synechococcus sp. CS-1325]MCT0213028.1 M23 family metallopeptidase [Synechococcus sp. CS-1326]PZV02523.1 MAG: M23 family peptidase [Cyanobium sp.]